MAAAINGDLKRARQGLKANRNRKGELVAMRQEERCQARAARAAAEAERQRQASLPDYSDGDDDSSSGGGGGGYSGYTGPRCYDPGGVTWHPC